MTPENQRTRVARDMAVPKLDGAPESSKIMVVDDEPLVSLVVCRHLETAGYSNFVRLADSRAALDAVASERPDIIILDHCMPHVTGLELLESLRGRAGLETLPILILTASTDAGVKRNALELGVTDFITKPPEPAELIARVRNALAAKRRYDELETLNRGLEERILERTSELREALETVADLDRLKQRFLMLVSHEMRTPVTICSGFAELLYEDLLQSSDERDEALEAIYGQCSRLTDITADVDRIMRLTADFVKPASSLFGLSELIGQTRARWQSRFDSKGIELCVPSNPELELRSDSELLSDSLDRIVSNALQFTESGSVSISSISSDEVVTIEVADTGCGIAEEHHSQVLDLFGTGRQVLNHMEGRGLGLAIVDRQVRLLGGTVGFFSKGEGHGTTFWVTVPLTPPS